MRISSAANLALILGIASITATIKQPVRKPETDTTEKRK